LKFAFFMMPLHHPSENPSLAFDRDIDLINYAEELGYDEFWIGEHHSAGWETIPAPEMVLAKASATARTIRLGTSVLSLPFHHPFHVAERMAFLDHLTRGRAMLGVGQSNLPPDIKLFNIPAGDLRTMMAESVEIIVKLLESPEPVSFSGKYWKIKDMVLQLRSYQSPRLPLAVATTGSRGNLELAGRHGMILLSSLYKAPQPVPGTLGLGEQWPFVEEVARKNGRTVSRGDWRAVTYVHLADTREKAWEEAAPGIRRDQGYFAGIGARGTQDHAAGKQEDPLDPKVAARHGRWIIGTPDDAIEQIEAVKKESGGIGGIMITTHEWLPHLKIKYSMELFARYVMPHFRGHVQDLQRAWQRTLDDNKAGALPPFSAPPSATPPASASPSNLFVNR
jgi:limonene 1,2-monooxygenase